MPDADWWAKVAADRDGKVRITVTASEAEAMEAARGLRNHAAYLKGYANCPAMSAEMERLADEIERFLKGAK